MFSKPDTVPERDDTFSTISRSSTLIDGGDHDSLTSCDTLIPKVAPPSPRGLDELDIRTSGNMLFSTNTLYFHSRENEPPIFNMTVSNRARVCTMYLHEGPGRKGYMFGGTQFDKFLRKIEVQQIGVSVSALENSHEKYLWKIPAEFPFKEGPNKVEKIFEWNQVKPEGSPSFTNPNWKLIDAESNEVHAVLVWKVYSKSETGKLQFRRSLGREWEIGVLLTVGTMLEREKQRMVRNGMGLAVANQMALG